MILNENHRKGILVLAAKRKTILKQEADSSYLEVFDKVLDDYLNPNDNCKVLVGHFVKGELICVAGMYGWDDRPVWTLTNLKTDPRFTFSGVKKNGISACFLELLEIAEKQGRYKYFFVAPIRAGNEGPGLFILQKKIDALKRYSMTSEAKVKSGTMPEKNFHRVMLGQKTFSVDVGIYSATLKNEFR